MASAARSAGANMSRGMSGASSRVRARGRSPKGEHGPRRALQFDLRRARSRRKLFQSRSTRQPSVAANGATAIAVWSRPSPSAQRSSTRRRHTEEMIAGRLGRCNERRPDNVGATIINAREAERDLETCPPPRAARSLQGDLVGEKRGACAKRRRARALASAVMSGQIFWAAPMNDAAR